MPSARTESHAAAGAGWPAKRVHGVKGAIAAAAARQLAAEIAVEGASFRCTLANTLENP